MFELLNNYESIKERIGYKDMNQDNKFFKKQIIKKDTNKIYI